MICLQRGLMKNRTSGKARAASEVGMKMVQVTIILAIAIALAAGSAFAAPARIASLEQYVQDPVRVALDAAGNVYVTDMIHNSVLVYRSTGAYVGTLNLPPKSYPRAIAVNANGALYVGVGSQVKVFNADFSSAGCLGGAVCANFKNLNDIHVDGAGNIYAVDNYPEISVVKVFDARGVLTGTISGSDASRLNKPTAVAVDDANGEIIIADQPDVVVTTNGTTATVSGTRIQVFDATGTVIRSLGTFGGGEVGPLDAAVSSAVDIALDGKGQVYIADMTQNNFKIMSQADGTILNTLYSDSGTPGFQPSGIAISKNGLAYIVWQKGSGSSGRVDIYGLDGYVTMTTGPASLLFEGRQYAGNPAAQTISIANSGSGTLNWTASKSVPWIVLGQDAGTTGPGAAASLSVGVDISSMIPGSLSGAVTITTDYGQQSTIGVTVNVLNPFILNISNGSLSFAAKKGKTAPAQAVTLGVDNLTTSAAWSASADSTWLAITPAAGTFTAEAPAVTASITVNTAGLAVGTYTGIITLSAPGVIGDGNRITVTLAVTSTTKISVATNRPEAKFTVSGPASYSGSGTSWSVEDAPAGDYVVAYDAVAGYKKPAPEKKTLVEDSEAAFSGVYVSWQDIAARKNIMVAKGLDATSDGLIKAYKNTGDAVAGFDFTAMENSSGATVAVADVDGDGAADLIIGSGYGSPAMIKVFRQDKSLLLEFAPFAGDGGVVVAAGDFDGNGTTEIVAMPAKGKIGEDANLLIFSYDTASATMLPAGAALSVSGTPSNLTFAAADLDGDGAAELVIVNSAGGTGSVVARTMKINAAQGVGSWTAAVVAETPLGANATGLAVALGDVDCDGKSEIIAALKNDSTQGAVIEIVKDGTVNSKFTVFDKSDVAGVSLASADLDGDGKADIIAAPSVRMQRKADVQAGLNGQVRVYSAEGALRLTVTSYEKLAVGVNIAVGDMGL